MTLSTQYVAEGDRIRCTRHGVTFARTSVCETCLTDPGAPPDDETFDLPPPPLGCLSSEDIERKYVNGARAISKLIATAHRDHLVEDWHVLNTIAKLHDTRIKYLRAASERARYREDEQVVKERERRKREADGSASH